MYLVLGDWSNDGHGKSNKILVESNYTVDFVQQAYKDSCRLTGVSFNKIEWQEDFTNGAKNAITIADEYEEPFVPAEALILFTEKFGLTPQIINSWGGDYDYKKDEKFCLNEDSFVKLWFWFVRLSHPDLEIREVPAKESIPCINGYWDKNLNVQFGYGLYQ